MTCDKCGVELRVGDFPFCNGASGHGRSVSAVHQDSVEGGFWAENGFSKPRYFESRKAHRDALAAEGKEIAAKHAGPNDKIMIDWAAGIDAQTLENARILLTRGQRSTAPVEQPFPIEVTTIEFSEG